MLTAVGFRSVRITEQFDPFRGTTKERTARNPKTGDAVHVPARTVVAFKPGRIMKQKVVDVIPN